MVGAGTDRVSVNLISPAFAPAIIPALETNESVKVDFPWSTWAMTDMFLHGERSERIASERGEKQAGRRENKRREKKRERWEMSVGKQEYNDKARKKEDREEDARLTGC
jgi:hypothetical protein